MSSVSSVKGASRLMPAKLIRMSTWPNRSITASNIARTCSRLATSAWTFISRSVLPTLAAMRS